MVLDYTDPEFLPTLKKVSSFDVILDFAGLAENSANFLQLLRPWSNAKLVTLSSPLLKSTDEEGIGENHALKKYDQFALNTSCFWGSTGSNITPIVQFHEIFVTKIMKKITLLNS